MRVLIIIAVMLAAYLRPTPADAATFHTIPPMLVLSQEESQDMMRKEMLSRMIEAGMVTEAQAEGMHSIKIHSIVLENGLWGIVIVPVEIGPEVGATNQ